MLTMAETRETTKHLSAGQLRKWAEVCKNLRFYYKHGKWKKGTDPESSYCTLCKLAEQNEDDGAISTCSFCAWKMLEDQICFSWFIRIQPLLPDKYITIFDARLDRSRVFTPTRIRMLDKWVRRLNALADRKQAKENNKC